MKYDFDQEIRRTGTNSVKWQIYWRGDKRELWEGTDPDLGAERTLPMWVADMDFPIAEPIRDAMRARIDHPIFGYVVRTPDYNEAITGWMERRHGWKVEQDWIVNTPGVVPALNLLVRALTEPGDKVLIQRPVYYPFTYAIENNGREDGRPQGEALRLLQPAQPCRPGLDRRRAEAVWRDLQEERCCRDRRRDPWRSDAERLQVRAVRDARRGHDG